LQTFVQQRLQLVGIERMGGIAEVGCGPGEPRGDIVQSIDERVGLRRELAAQDLAIRARSPEDLALP